MTEKNQFISPAAIEQGNNMKVTYYICHNCWMCSDGMTLATDEHYVPTEKDLQSRCIPKEVQHEILVCECGYRHSWFSLMERVEDE
jgi:hypothetical protein